MKKIGVLIPQSKAFPRMGKEFLNGLRLSFENDSDIEYKIEGIGVANSPQVVIDGIQKLVNQEDVQVITGILGHKGLSEILDFVEGIGENILYSDFGATAPIDLANRKGVWCNSLELYYSANLLGKYFSDKGINNVGISTSYYDAGYGFLEAMEKALNDSESGQISGHFVTPLNPRDNEGEILAQFVTESKSDAIFAFHNGVFAKEHASYLKGNDLAKKAPIYTLPFSIEKSVLEEFPEVFNDTFCSSTWMANLNTQENQDFVKAYTEEYNIEPSLFALLGFENGILLNEYFSNKGKFSEEKLTGPRGGINVDSSSNRTSHTHYLWQLKYEDGNYRNDSLQELNYEISEGILGSAQEQGGWHNGYLCH